MNKPMTGAEYVENAGLKCPYCQSTTIEAREVHVEAGKAYQPVDCLSCEKEWLDVYQLTGWQPE